MLNDGSLFIIGGHHKDGTFSQTCLRYHPLTNTLRQAAPLQLGRRFCTVTVLPDGRVLVAGGETATGATNRCEIYDPLLDRWSEAAPMAVARNRHAQLLLYDGRVMVIGGYGSTFIASCEIYTPSTNTWQQTGALNSARNHFGAVLLPDSSVLAAGGYPYPRSCERYTPSTGTWTAVAALPSPFPVGANLLTLLPNGLVLTAGGWGGTQGMTDFAALWDPVSGTWRQTSPLLEQRAQPQGVLLTDGTILAVAGYNATTPGADITNYSVATVDRYNPHTEVWSSMEPTPAPVSLGVCALLPNGNVFLGGGGRYESNRGIAEYYTSSYLLPTQPLQVAVRAHNPLFAGIVAGVPTANGRILVSRAAQCGLPPLADSLLVVDALESVPTTSPVVGTSAGGLVLMQDGGTLALAGGSGGTGGVRTAVIDSNGLSTVYPGIQRARSGYATITLPTGTVLVLGGSDSSGTVVLDDVIAWSPLEQRWTSRRALPTPRTHATATLLEDGRVLVVGGSNTVGQALATTDLYDPTCNRWQPGPALSTPRADHTATLLADGDVLVAGGCDAASAERWSVAANTWSPVPMNMSRRSHTATLLPNGSVLIAGGISSDGARSIQTTEIYVPVANHFDAGPVMSVPRHSHSAVPTTGGDVALLGGSTLTPQGCDPPDDYEVLSLYDVEGRNARPTITGLSTTSIVRAVGNDISLTVKGENFQDNLRSQSNGTSYDYTATPTNHPVVEIRRIGACASGVDFVQYLPFDVGSATWSSSSTTVRITRDSLSLLRLPAGIYHLSVITSGLRSNAVPLQIIDTSRERLPLLASSTSRTCDSGFVRIQRTRCSVPPTVAADSTVLVRFDSSDGEYFLTFALDGRSRLGHYSVDPGDGSPPIVDSLAPSTDLALTFNSATSVVMLGPNETVCDTVTVTNAGDIPLTLTSCHFVRGRTFSIPPSQLPLVVPSRSSVPLTICIEPEMIGSAVNDTLILKGPCLLLSAALAARTDGIIGEGTVCSTRVAMRQIGMGKLLAGTPRYGSDGVSVDVVATAPLGSVPAELCGRLLTPAGTEVATALWRPTLTRTRPDGTEVQGRFVCPPSLSSGAYLLVIEADDGAVTVPLVIVR